MAKPFSSLQGPSVFRTLADIGKYSLERQHLMKKEHFAKYGDIYKHKLGPGINLVQIFHPDDVATVFRADDKHPLRPPIPLVITAQKRDGFVLGLGALNGEKWYTLRSAVQKLMMPPKAAAAYLPAQNHVADKFIALVHTSLDESGELPNFANIIWKYTMESIAVVCFGQEMGCLHPEIAAGSEADIMIRETASLFQAVQKTTFAFPWHALFRTPFYKQFIDAKNKCEKISRAHIEAALRQLEQDDNHRFDQCPYFLSTLLSAHRLTPEQIIGITSDLFTAGIDSTANALSFVVYNLSRNLDKQDKLWREISSVFTHEREVTAGDFDKLPYLKAVVKESFRLNFPVEGGTTRILSKDVVLGGYNVPKNVIYATFVTHFTLNFTQQTHNVAIAVLKCKNDAKTTSFETPGCPNVCWTVAIFNNQTMCLQERYFEFSESYIPERWLKDGSATTAPPPKFVMLPFGYGPRMCIGRRFAEQEIYLALIKIVQAFEVSYVGTEEVGMINRVFTMPDKPIKLCFKPRSMNG